MMTIGRLPRDETEMLLKKARTRALLFLLLLLLLLPQIRTRDPDGVGRVSRPRESAGASRAIGCISHALTRARDESLYAVAHFFTTKSRVRALRETLELLVEAAREEALLSRPYSIQGLRVVR